MQRKILIMGLPGAGKTTLARVLAARINAVHFNADAVRENVNRDLGFSVEDRIEQARRMGWLCDRVTEAGNFAMADFICPTRATRAAFLSGGDGYIVWVDRVATSRFTDTDMLFEPPERVDLRVTRDGSPEYWAERVAAAVRPVFDAKRPTSLFVGRYQPFHDGHKLLVEEGLRRVGQACIAVRDTTDLDADNPFAFEATKARIEHMLREHQGRFTVIPVPNITQILYGRDVGYQVSRIDLGEDVERISATILRQRLGVSSGTAASQPPRVDA